MSNAPNNDYKGKSIVVDEEPNDEWENPTCDDNIILRNYVMKCLWSDPIWYKTGYPLPPKLDASNNNHTQRCSCCMKSIKIENEVKDLQEELRELHLAYKNNFMMMANVVKNLAKDAAQRCKK